jgi:murein L,D-transpeptidase YcbB/YkuD
MRRFPLPVAFTALSLFLIACGGKTDELAERVRTSITHLAVSDSLSFLAGEDNEYHAQVEAFYRQRDFEPAWIKVEGSNESLRDMLSVLCEAEEVGLNRLEYVNRSLKRRIDGAYGDEAPDDSLRARSLALLDITLTNTLMDYAADVLTGRLDPRDVGTAWHTPVREIDLLGVITDTTSSASLRSLSRIQSRRHPQFGKLIDALGMYRVVKAKGGWPRVPDGETITADDTGPRVAALIARLAAVGDLDSSLVAATADSARYTKRIARGVERFQERHGMEADGVAGEEVIRKMNVDVDARIRQIELNLERWRWIPPHLGSRYVYVNVPAFELHAVENGEEAMSMAVVVGEEYEDNATPVFSDTMEYVVFNPYWNVPEAIASTEILPEARDDPDYLSENGYEIVAGWDEGADVVSPDRDALDLVESGEYRIRQVPGPQNALGHVKFMFPNDFNIYLHDTPEEHLFDRARRAYSHGCIRVERPVDLADFVFSSDELGSESIRRRMDSGEQATEYIDDPLPVYILYWTAFVDDDGRVNFREDIYDNDSALLEALDALVPAGEGISCESIVVALDD